MKPPVEQGQEPCPRVKQMLTVLRENMPMLRGRYKVSYLGLFGSYVRGEERPDSDLDVLVEFEEKPSLLGYVALRNELSDLLGVEVELAMRSNLQPAIGGNILREVVPV